MAKKAYIGVAGVARKVKKVYCGIDGVARKVKKGYIGVGGIARPIGVGNAELAYYGAATNMQNDRRSGVGISFGAVALFGGGIDSAAISVDAYNAALVKSALPNLATSRYIGAGAANESYAFFAGGTVSNVPVDSVDAYNTSFVKSVPAALTQALSNIGAARAGIYAVFAGGYNADGNTTSTANAYDKNMAKATPGMGNGFSSMKGATINGNAIFAGGFAGTYSGSVSGTVLCFNQTLGRSSLSDLSTPRVLHAVAANDNYVAVGGGKNSSNGYVSSVETYTAANVKGQTLSLSVGRSNLAAARAGHFVLFAGGYISGGRSNVVDGFDENGVRVFSHTLRAATQDLLGAAVGEFALFAGGDRNGSEVAAYISL